MSSIVCWKSKKEIMFVHLCADRHHSRRHRRKLNLFYKIRNNDSPLYLYDCLLPFIREENELNMRNQTEFRNPFTRLQLFANFFFPSTIKSWNKLCP